MISTIRYCSIALFCILCFKGFSQKVGIGTTAPHPSSALDINSSSAGMLLPRMSTAQRLAISNPADGLLVYDLDKHVVCMFDGISWLPLMYRTSFNKLPPHPVGSPTDLNNGDNFGFDIQVDGNYAIIGAPYDTIGSNAKQGSAYIYYFTNGLWTQQAKLTAADGAEEDWFGFAVSISGDYAVVGAPHHENSVEPTDENGSVYIFQRSGNNWTQLAQLIPSDSDIGDQFGYDVRIDVDYLIAGAAFEDNGGQFDNGSAYMYYRNAGWTNSQPYQAKLIGNNLNSFDEFGTSVALSGDQCIIGSPYNNSTGGAYIFSRSGTVWTQISRLGITNQMTGMMAGFDVDIDGDYAIVGSPGWNTGRGAVHIYFKGVGWINNHAPQIFISNAGGFSGSNYGKRVSIDGDFSVILCPGCSTSPVYSRSATTWTIYRGLEDDTGSAGPIAAVDIYGFNVLLGFPLKSTGKGEIQALNIQ